MFSARGLSLTFFAASLAAASVAQSAETPAAAPVPVLHSAIVDWAHLAPQATAVGQRRDVFNAPTATLARLDCHVTTLNPGAASHPPHRHPQEEVIFIMEGTVSVSINGENHAAGPGSVVFFASNDRHNLTNTGAGPATYVVLQFTTPAIAASPTTLWPAPTAPKVVRSGVWTWPSLAVSSTSTGERREIFEGTTATFAHLECHATTLRPGESPHPAHRHADEEIVLTRDGELQVEIDGTARRATAGAVALFVANDLHGWRNAGKDPATYFVIRFTPAAVHS